MVSPQNSPMFAHRLTSNNIKKAMTPCTNPLSTPWILRLSLSCFCVSMEEVWGHPRQVIVWVAHEGPGWEEARNDFAPAKKTSTFNFAPSPYPGRAYPNKTVSCLVCPDMSPTMLKKPRISSTLWGHMMRG